MGANFGNYTEVLPGSPMIFSESHPKNLKQRCKNSNNSDIEVSYHLTFYPEAEYLQQVTAKLLC